MTIRCKAASAWSVPNPRFRDWRGVMAGAGFKRADLELSVPTKRETEVTRRVENAAAGLLVDDAADMAQMLATALGNLGFSPSLAGSAVVLDFLLKATNVDLILHDGMLPGDDGLSICRHLHAQAIAPIIAVTSPIEGDRIMALDIAADADVTQPFNARELGTRVNALWWRASYSENWDRKLTILDFESWHIDLLSRPPKDRTEPPRTRPDQDHTDAPDSGLRARSADQPRRGRHRPW
jgi:CheY-like chemotaxis protein